MTFAEIYMTLYFSGLGFIAIILLALVFSTGKSGMPKMDNPPPPPTKRNRDVIDT